MKKIFGKGLIWDEDNTMALFRVPSAVGLDHNVGLGQIWAELGMRIRAVIVIDNRRLGNACTSEKDEASNYKHR